MLTVEDLIGQYPNQVWWEFSAAEMNAALPSSGDYSNDVARWNAYLNRLVLNALLPWLEEESSMTPVVWPNETVLPSIWEFMNGTAITLGSTRIVLIPSDAIDIEEFCIPQEWVDIPSWNANYYLAVQVNPDEDWLRVWGYATHEQIKTKGDYDEFSRTYSLEREDVVDRIQVMWVARQLCPDEKVPVPSPPTLSENEAETLISRLSQPSCYSRRLDVEFPQWGAILANPTWRQQLYQRRNREVAPVTPEPNLAFAFRGGDMEPENPETVRNLIDEIYTGADQHRLKVVAERLGEIGGRNEDAIAALIHLIRTTEDEETRWAAAESLWTLDPNNPASGIRKVADLGMQIADRRVALMVALLPRADRTVAILLRVYPLQGSTDLPSGLRLIVLDEDGDTFLDTDARNTDEYIQLKFGGSSGERFSVRVAVGDVAITEDFTI